MRNRKRFQQKNQQAFIALIKAMKSNGALEPVQVECVERIEKLVDDCFHALDVSKSAEAKRVLGLISKEFCDAFLKVQAK